MRMTALPDITRQHLEKMHTHYEAAPTELNWTARATANFSHTTTTC